MTDETTNPAPVDGPVADQEVAPEEPEAVEAQETEGEEGDQPAETVEVELDGQTYSVPADLKDSFMKAADYTQKTQELAEQRRQAEETLGKERDSFIQQAQAHRQSIQLYGELAHTDALLEKFQQVDWVKLQQEDPDQAQQLGFQRETLRDRRDALESEIEKKEYESRVTAEREHANRKDQLEATLARDIPNYSPELRTEMQQTAVRHGYTEQEVASVTDPRAMKMLHLAHLGEQVLKRQTATPKPKPVKPVSKVTGGSTPEKGPTDKQSTEAWMKRRNEQLRQRAG
ncbi:MAG: hypothetical protein ACR2RF_25010 [Geminicoccaceae bacterium]